MHCSTSIFSHNFLSLSLSLCLSCLLPGRMYPHNSIFFLRLLGISLPVWFDSFTLYPFHSFSLYLSHGIQSDSEFHRGIHLVMFLNLRYPCIERLPAHPRHPFPITQPGTALIGSEAKKWEILLDQDQKARSPRRTGNLVINLKQRR